MNRYTQKVVIATAFDRLYIAVGVHLPNQMLLLVGSILVASASIYEGHNTSGLLALILRLRCQNLSRPGSSCHRNLCPRLRSSGR